jgi:hypothetical protein
MREVMELIDLGPKDLRCAPRASQILKFSRRLFSPCFFIGISSRFYGSRG